METNDIELFDNNIRKIQEIKSSKNWEEMKQYIVPFLFTGNLFPNSRSEFRMEMEDFYDEDELDALCEEERPDVAVYKWNGFGLTFILDWSIGFEKISAASFLPLKVIPEGFGMDRLIKTARINMSKKHFVLTNMDELCQDEDRMHLFSVSYSPDTIPSYTPGILLDNMALKNIHYLLGEDFVIIPYHTDAVYVMGKSGYLNRKRDDIFSAIERTAGMFRENFSKRVFEFTKSGITAIR